MASFGGRRAGSGKVCVKQGDFVVILGEGWHALATSTLCRLQKTMPSFSQVVEEAVGNQPVHAAVVGGSSSSAAFRSLQRCAYQVTCSFSLFSRVFPFSHLAAVAHKTLPVKGSAPDVAQVRHSGVGGWSLGAGRGRIHQGFASAAVSPLGG